MYSAKLLASERTIKSERTPKLVYGYDTLVLSLEGLIRTKEAAARPKDLRMLPELRALLALRDAPDQMQP